MPPAGGTTRQPMRNRLCHGVGRLIGWLQILRRQIVPFQHTNLTLVNV